MAKKREREVLVSRYSARARHYLRKHRYAARFASRGLHDIASQLRDCQETEVLICCQNCGHHRYIVDRCRLRVCPLCSFERSRERARYIVELTKQMQYPKMLTLTMPVWRGVPQEGIKHLRRNWNRLRKVPCMSKVRGGAYQIEVKVKDRGYHIHMHAILDAPFIPYQQVFSAWRSLLGTQAPQVHIKAASTEREREYCAKYAAKAADFYSHPDAVVDWYEATKGQRLFATFGAWYNVKLEDLLNDEDTEQPIVKCPRCGAEKSMFNARDGPIIYGYKEWTELKYFFQGQCESTRDISEIRSQIREAQQQAKAKRQAKQQQEALPV